MRAANAVTYLLSELFPSSCCENVSEHGQPDITALELQIDDHRILAVQVAEPEDMEMEGTVCVVTEDTRLAEDFESISQLRVSIENLLSDGSSSPRKRVCIVSG